MDSRSLNDSDGGGGHRGGSPSVTSSLDSQLGEERPQPQPPPTQDSPSGSGLTDGQPPNTPAVLSLDQIRITGSSNDYTEGPSVTQRSPASLQRQQNIDLVSSSTDRQPETQEDRQNNLLNLHPLTHGNAFVSSMEGVLRLSGVDGSQSGIRTSEESVSSGQRLAISPAGGSQIIRTQPTRAVRSPEELKPLNIESRAVVALPGSRSSKNQAVHSNRCRRCGRCCCSECRRPRVFPSCWLCARRCMCSVQNVVEYGTCVCCIKGLFYHCSSDDEDTCTDKPFSCSQQQRCVRWTTVAVLSLCCPCLLCYLPARGCLAVCQSCYDRAARPGCRCRNPNPVRREDTGKLV